MQRRNEALPGPLIDTAHMNIDDIFVRLPETTRSLLASRIFNGGNVIIV